MFAAVRYSAALVALALIVSACSAGGGSSPQVLASAAEPTASSTPAESSPAPSTEAVGDGVPPVVDPPAGLLPPGSVAVVTVDGLRLRNSHPGIDPGAEIVQTLDTGALVTVGSSPFAYLAADRSPDGRAWYQVVTGGRPASDGEGVFGWVAAGDNGLEFLRIEPVNCPAEVTLEALLWTPAGGDGPPGMRTTWDRLACVGNRSLELEGVFETCYEGGLYPYTFDPPHLAAPAACANLLLDDIDESGRSSRGGSLPIGIPPALASVPLARGDVIRVTGHFDDPASATCTATPSGDFESDVDPAFLTLACRERFVVDELEVIGHRELAPLP